MIREKTLLCKLNELVAQDKRINLQANINYFRKTVGFGFSL